VRTTAKNVIHPALNSGEVDVAICIEGGDDSSEDALSSRFAIEMVLLVGKGRR
jgi:hypothetical protein